MQKRNDIQLLRAIAIIAVVVIHTYIHNIGGVIVRAFVNFAVPLFFFLSGYLTIFPQNRNFRFKRIKKVLIPYIVWSLFYALLPDRNGFNVSVDKVLVGLLTGSCSYHLYFIPVYIQVMLLTEPLFMLLSSRFKYLGLLLTPMALLLFKYILPQSGILYPKALKDINLFLWVTYYYIGLGFGNRKFACLQMRSTVIFVFLAFVFSVSEGVFWFVHGDYNMATTQCRISSCVYAMSFLYLCANTLEQKILVFFSNNHSYLILLGELSGGIYFMHVFWIRIINALGRFVHPFMAAFPVSTVLTVIVSVFSILLLKKYFPKKLCALFGL